MPHASAIADACAFHGDDTHHEATCGLLRPMQYDMADDVRLNHFVTAFRDDLVAFGLMCDEHVGRLIEAEWTVCSAAGTRSKSCRARYDCGTVAEYGRGNITAGRITHCARCRLKPRRPKVDRRLKGISRSLLARHQCVRAWQSFETFASDVGTIPPWMTIKPIRKDRPVGPRNFRLSYSAEGEGKLGKGLRFRGRAISQAEAARLLGVSRQAVHDALQIERRKLALVERLAKLETAVARDTTNRSRKGIE